MFLRLLPLLSVLACAAGLALRLRESWLALLAVPAVYLGPGLALRLLFSRGPVDPLRVGLDAFFVGVAPGLAVLAVSRHTGSPWASLGAAGLVSLAALASRARGLVPLSRPERTGLGVAVLLLGAWFHGQRADIARPLERYWWPGEGAAERLPEVAPSPGTSGFDEVEAVSDAGLLRLRGAGTIEAVVPVLLALQAPVGSVVRVGDREIEVRASPVEEPGEGPVRRYLPGKLGVVAAWIEAPTEVEAPLVFAIPSQDALWTLDGSGELRVAHYYQLLNMVEQVDWAADRWVTDVQPPFWTPIYGAVLAITGGDLPTANVLHAAVLLGAVLAGLLFLRNFAGEAPLPAWCLPGAAAVVAGKLVVTAGSAGMPDTLYAVALLAAVAAVGDEPFRAGRFEALGLAAQLLRYPATGVTVVAALLAGRWRAALRLATLVLAAAAAFGLGGLATGAVDGWLRTVAWESGPEHWHGETDPAVLLGRVPGFYWAWLLYSGGGLCLAAIAWPRGTRVALGTALVYSLLLCTIDHRPTHYFLPLVLLSAAATGSTSGALRPALGTGLSLAGLGGLLIFWFRGPIVE